MHRIHQLVLVVVCLGFTGCVIKHDYSWNEYPIAPDRVTTETISPEGKEVKVISGKANETKIDLGHVGAHHYYGTEQQLTDAIVHQLSMELQKRGVENKTTATKTLEVAVTHSRFESGMWRIAASLDFTIKLGDAEPKTLSVRNSSPMTVDRTYNGVVALAVIEILNHEEVLEYLRN